jgi:hypothetical protein
MENTTLNAIIVPMELDELSVFKDNVAKAVAEHLKANRAVPQVRDGKLIWVKPDSK